ncbi:MAG: twitching motility protein PilT [Thermovibrio sp.]|nr:MAG: twitching motility protein PilT [Thermovibrio sp.]
MRNLFGAFLLFLLLVTLIIFKNYGFTLTQSLILSIFISAASFLFYQFILRRRVSVKSILLFSFGFFLGLYLAKGITLSLFPIFSSFTYLQDILFLTLPYLFGFLAVEVGRNRPITEILKEESPLYCTIKVVDTSALIDGRIYEIARIGFIEGKIVIPRFVLEELQNLADSTDPMVRTKGKKGLEIVSRLRSLEKPPVEIYERDFPWIRDVDAKLVELSRRLRAKLITTDYNLNKVASIKGIEILNINDLANALKPVVAVGEELVVFLVKEGKEKNQGVGYLDDGTMVVVDNAKHLIGHKIKVLVNNILQTSSGKIIFGRFKEVVK